MTTEVLDLNDGRYLRRWTDQHGQAWACEMDDHGPSCSKCVRVDPITDALLQNVADGLMAIGPRAANGEMRFAVTSEGERRAKHLIEQRSDDDD